MLPLFFERKYFMIIDAKELKRRYLQRIAGARDRQVYIGPEIVALNTTNSCNLRCLHCWTHSPRNPAHLKKTYFFPWKKFLGIVGDCVDLNVDQIHIVGSGEPTMHPLFRDMMRHLEQQPLKVKVFTNGAFPLDYCLDVIKADHVLIDISAADRQQYREVHGKDFFDRVVNNIKRLVSLRDTRKPGFIIEVAYIVNAINISQKQKMQDLVSKLGINRISFERMNLHDYNQEVALPEGPIADLEGEEEKTPPICLNGWFYMLARDGHISTCCRTYQLPLGDLSFKQHWLSPQIMSMRLLGKYGRMQKMFKACQTCVYYDENIQRSKDLAKAKRK
ncbi:MAG: radical SAM protein [Candidatus Omnitrophica bacterium]|nr:radical SAM protein [Candidatus Omnitrophota bacterium]